MKAEIKIEKWGWVLILLTALLMTLKLSGHIAWSWLWVLSPLWLPLAAMGCFLAAVLFWVGSMVVIVVVNAAAKAVEEMRE